MSRLQQLLWVIPLLILIEMPAANGMYDPNLGRFCSRDPILYKGVIGLYEIATSRIAISVDPFGLSSPPLMNEDGLPIDGWEVCYDCHPKPKFPNPSLWLDLPPRNNPPKQAGVESEDACSGYPKNGVCTKTTCYLWKKEIEDSYPAEAKKCCRGFLKLYQKPTLFDPGWEPTSAVTCVAKCLVAAENDECSLYVDCESRSMCRHEAHKACYDECGFIPYKGMPMACLSIAPEVIGF